MTSLLDGRHVYTMENMEIHGARSVVK